MKRISSRQDGKPAMQFYPDDWLSEPGLRAATPEVRGVWIDLLCYMWKSPERGVLLLPDGSVPTAEVIQKLCGLTPKKWTRIETALIQLGIASRRQPDGALCCRRMVREAEAEKRKSELGRRAVSARWNIKETQKQYGSDTESAKNCDTEAIRKSHETEIRNAYGTEYGSDTEAIRNAYGNYTKDVADISTLTPVREIRKRYGSDTERNTER
jgi:hypothetical protein